MTAPTDATADIPIRGDRVTLEITSDAEGRMRGAHLDRWHDPDGNRAFGWFPFGVEAGASRAFPCGITMPADGTGGWFHETPRWREGQFIRYSISGLTLV